MNAMAQGGLPADIAQAVLFLGHEGECSVLHQEVFCLLFGVLAPHLCPATVFHRCLGNQRPNLAGLWLPHGGEITGLVDRNRECVSKPLR